ncbi:class I SAM-dependent methyltransferase [Geitlerinema sp. CS-897]|nr:class I SAM-dependent methyltransferase [Geitlerinema sp. CS-897]
MSKNSWQSSLKDYEKFVVDRKYDSEYLRRVGLHSNLLDIINRYPKGRLLDVGCGDGWMFRYVKGFEYHSCDVTEPADRKFIEEGRFSLQDIRKLSYESDSFDIVVASLVLIWFSEIELAVKELCRVTDRSNGSIIVALVNPYFYRTGYVDTDSHFKITADLSKDFIIKDHKISGLVGPFSYYYRPPYKYINLFLKNGVHLKNIFDWFIDIDDYNSEVSNRENSKIRRTGKVPLFTFMEFSYSSPK